MMEPARIRPNAPTGIRHRFGSTYTCLSGHLISLRLLHLGKGNTTISCSKSCYGLFIASSLTRLRYRLARAKGRLGWYLSIVTSA